MSGSAIMSKVNIIGKTATDVVTGPSLAVSVKYHKTVVWERDEGGKVITLRTGGWKTPTTKRRMNQAFQQFGYSIVVSSSRGFWYVNDNRDPKVWTRSIRFEVDLCIVEV